MWGPFLWWGGFVGKSAHLLPSHSWIAIAQKLYMLESWNFMCLYNFLCSFWICNQNDYSMYSCGDFYFWSVNKSKKVGTLTGYCVAVQGYEWNFLLHHCSMPIAICKKPRFVCFYRMVPEQSQVKHWKNLRRCTFQGPWMSCGTAPSAMKCI